MLERTNFEFAHHPRRETYSETYRLALATGFGLDKFPSQDSETESSDGDSQTLDEFDDFLLGIRDDGEFAYNNVVETEDTVMDLKGTSSQDLFFYEFRPLDSLIEPISEFDNDPVNSGSSFLPERSEETISSFKTREGLQPVLTLEGTFPVMVPETISPRESRGVALIAKLQQRISPIIIKENSGIPLDNEKVPESNEDKIQVNKRCAESHRSLNPSVQLGSSSLNLEEFEELVRGLVRYSTPKNRRCTCLEDQEFFLKSVTLSDAHFCSVREKVLPGRLQRDDPRSQMLQMNLFEQRVLSFWDDPYWFKNVTNDYLARQQLAGVDRRLVAQGKAGKFSLPLPEPERNWNPVLKRKLVETSKVARLNISGAGARRESKLIRAGAQTEIADPKVGTHGGSSRTPNNQADDPLAGITDDSSVSFDSGVPVATLIPVDVETRSGASIASGQYSRSQVELRDLLYAKLVILSPDLLDEEPTPWTDVSRGSSPYLVRGEENRSWKHVRFKELDDPFLLD